MTPIEYLLIDISNCDGYDKAPMEDRVKRGLTIANGDRTGITDGQLLNALDAYDRKDTTNHMMYFDATNSGLQLYSVLTSCKDTAKTCNVASGAVRADAYQMIADYMNNIIPSLKLNRNDCKKALMITLYASTDGAMRIVEELGFNRDDLQTFFNHYNIPYTITEDGYDSIFLDTFTESLYKLFPNAMKAMDALTALNDEEIGTYYWTMPDGFKVKYDVKSNVDVELHLTTKSGINFSFKTDVKKFKPSKYNRGMSPNIIHSFDGYVVREVVRRMKKEGKFCTAIHDAFATTPEHMEALVNHYKDILCEINESNYLNIVVAQILEASGKTVVANYIPKVNTLSCKEIRNSVYILS